MGKYVDRRDALRSRISMKHREHRKYKEIQISDQRHVVKAFMSHSMPLSFWQEMEVNGKVEESCCKVVPQAHVSLSRVDFSDERYKRDLHDLVATFSL